jgi:beta-phosphoglucomutase-like phosphatase (HAD superfamily)
MSPERAPFAALDEILRRARHLLIDFDGPICSLFAGTPTASIADRLRKVITRQDIQLPPTVANTTDWFEILAYAASIGPDLAASVEAELSELESAAVSTAVPTPYMHDVVAACHESGRSVAVVSNNSAAAVRAYLEAHDFAHRVDAIAARTRPDPTVLKPSPYLIEHAASALDSVPAACAVVGDSPNDMYAARSAGALGIGYARTPDDGNRLANAEARAVIGSMVDLVLRLRAHTLPS